LANHGTQYLIVIQPVSASYYALPTVRSLVGICKSNTRGKVVTVRIIYLCAAVYKGPEIW
jgi:hypothetical protein